MAFFQVTAFELRNKAEELRDLNQRFLSEEEKLNNYHDALNGMWEGETKESFSREFIRDKGRMDNFFNAINQYIEALNLVASKYEEAESRNVALANSRTV